MNGTVYLLHFEPRYLHAGHYLGWALDHEKRIEEHMSGKGNPLVKAAIAKGCIVTVAHVWYNVDRNFERTLKNRGGLARQCPICKNIVV